MHKVDQLSLLLTYKLLATVAEWVACLCQLSRWREKPAVPNRPCTLQYTVANEVCRQELISQMLTEVNRADGLGHSVYTHRYVVCIDVVNVARSYSEHPVKKYGPICHCNEESELIQSLVANDVGVSNLTRVYVNMM